MKPPSSVLLGVVLAACHAPAGAPKPPSSVPTHMTVRDDTPAFLAYWDRVRAEDAAVRAARYRTEIAPHVPGFWSYVARENGPELDARLARTLAAFAPLEDAFRTRALALPGQLTAAIGTMKRTFPDFDPAVEIRLVYGLGEMDGGTRVFDGRYYLMFGVDLVAKLHTWPDDRPFFVHELFHVYADQKTGRDGRSTHLIESSEEELGAREKPLYASLWEEGLATYVSEWLVPGATHASLLLDVPSGMETTCLANLPFLVEDLGAKLDSTRPDDYGDWFTFRSKDPPTPQARRLLRRLPRREEAPRRTSDAGAPCPRRAGAPAGHRAYAAEASAVKPHPPRRPRAAAPSCRRPRRP